MRRVLPAVVLMATTCLLLTSCAHGGDTVGANIALQYPADGVTGWLVARLYGLPVLAVLVIVVGVITSGTLTVNVLLARRGLRMPRWPLIIVAALSGALVVIAAVLLVLDSSGPFFGAG